MSALPVEKTETVVVSLEEYFERERLAEVKHEYVAGIVYAMAGASTAHNILAVNLTGLLFGALRGSACQPFGSDMQLRVRVGDLDYCYYPDAMIACDPNDGGNGWRERPSVIFEIISESTRSTDEREKRMAYLKLESLETYVRLEQNAPAVTIDRRTPAGWRAERISGLDQAAVFVASDREISLPLAVLYERVKFA